jgi:hypothetical protein
VHAVRAVDMLRVRCPHADDIVTGWGAIVLPLYEMDSWFRFAMDLRRLGLVYSLLDCGLYCLTLIWCGLVDEKDVQAFVCFRDGLG